MPDLSNKRALVTGASGGIGRAIAQALHDCGAAVVLSGTRRDALDELAAKLGEKAFSIQADLGDVTTEDVLVETASSAMGGIDILVNNAGITRDGLMLRMSDEDWQDVLNINLSTVFRLSRACLKGMMKARWGRIISISSVVGAKGNPGQANYAASKAGLVGMTKSLAAEVASRGITANCVAPGFITTAMTDALDENIKARLLENIPCGRFGSSEDVAAAVVYLASNEASYVTGETLHVNGGMAMV
jgi:3-oxoacyl-[acyl-carrier protein] reductase